jgi:integral membrane protein
MLNIFKKIAFWEGISLLVLLFIAMPFKYILDMPLLVKYVGMAHGILFIIYILLALFLSNKFKWPFSKLAIVCLASIIPFGTFYIEKKILY